MTKYKLPLINLSINILLAFICLLILPFAIPSIATSFAEYGEGSYCNAAGHTGTCWDRASRSCGTYYDSGNYCPGDNSVQCCVSSQVHCNNYTSSYCHNASNAGFGNYYNCSSVGGSFNSGGYCPGPWDVQCCVVPQQPPPTSVSASCPNPGTTATVNWTLPSGYSWAYPRFYDETTGATYYPGPTTNTSYSISTTPGHQYSYWVHTTNSIGEPWSSEVPTARTVKISCNAPTPTPTAIPPCGDPATPEGSVLSSGVNVTRSAVRNNNETQYGAGKAVDGSVTTYWDSGSSPTQWIELDLGTPQTVKGLVLNFHQSTNGVTTTQFFAGATTNPSTKVKADLSCYTQNNQTVNVIFSSPLDYTRYIRINTTQSPTNVAWNEISVYGISANERTSTPGIIFTGDHSADFGQGEASIFGWVVGGLTYPETYQQTGPSPTSYQFILDKVSSNGIPLVNMTTLSGCSNLASCTLPANLPNAVYQANGNLTLNSYNFPVNKNYIFLINGDLRVNGNLTVPNGSTAFFTAKNDIIVNRSVGTASNFIPLPAGQLQGIFSADRNVLIDSINNCITGPDKMLNVEGAFIINALGNGGTFTNNRDLCGNNPQFPVLTIQVRLDMLLNLPEILLHQRTTSREDAP